jgi:hypothetical protein
MPGSVCLFNGGPRLTHAQFADEAAADLLEGVVEKNGKKQAVWKTTGRNEMGDVVAGAAALPAFTKTSRQEEPCWWRAAIVVIGCAAP